MKRVYIVCSHPLLGHGIERLVASAEGVEVVGQGRDLARSLPLISALCPDAVVVAGEASEEAQAHLFLRLLREGLCGRVIVLNTQCNALCVYRGTRLEVGGVGDLIAAIDEA